MAVAAFFDLDRTLIAGSSAEVFGAKLAEVGLSTPALPGQFVLYKLFETIGEDPVTMRLARHVPRLFAGRRVADVEVAARRSAAVLAPRVLPHARAEIDRHRSAGARLVLATTTPHDLVAPLADRLGFDDVISTRYRSIHGVYDGTLDGPLVWGADKAKAVSEWAAANGIDLARCSAYSDSWYDLAMLERVGHPVVVNPDVRLRAAATARRWPVRDFEHLPGVPSLAGVEGQQLLMPLFDPRLSIFAEIELDGARHLPRRGPVIIVANHRSYFDPFALGYLGAERDRSLRFLAKKELLEAPVVGPLVGALGTIPVDRGSGSSRPLDAAAQALRGGEAVVVLPQGTIPRGADFYKARLRGRSGAVRLAQRTGAPLVPVGLWGTERVWPRSRRLPRATTIAERPSVSVRVGPPIRVDPEERARAATNRVMAAIQALLPEEAQHDRVPTTEELAATEPT